MLPSQANASLGSRSDDQRYLGMTAGEIAHLGRLVDDFVHANGHPVNPHNLDYWTHSSHGCSQRITNDCCFGNGRIKHALVTEHIIYPFCGTEGTAQYSDILPHEEYPIVPCHLLFDGLAYCFTIAYLSLGHLFHSFLSINPGESRFWLGFRTVQGEIRCGIEYFFAFRIDLLCRLIV